MNTILLLGNKVHNEFARRESSTMEIETGKVQSVHCFRIYFCFSFCLAISLNRLKSRGSLSPSHVARCVWFLSSSSSSSVLGCTRTLSGPRLVTNQGMKAPNCTGVNRLTSNIPIGWGPIGRSNSVYMRSSGTYVISHGTSQLPVHSHSRRTRSHNAFAKAVWSAFA